MEPQVTTDQAMEGEAARATATSANLKEQISLCSDGSSLRYRGCVSDSASAMKKQMSTQSLCADGCVSDSASEMKNWSLSSPSYDTFGSGLGCLSSSNRATHAPETHLKMNSTLGTRTAMDSSADVQINRFQRLMTPDSVNNYSYNRYGARRFEDTLQRERSFDIYWFPAITQTPRQMAQAGFFYTGPGDRVRCYRCGLVLHNWIHGESVAAAHLFYAREKGVNCAFIEHNHKQLEMLGG